MKEEKNVDLSNLFSFIRGVFKYLLSKWLLIFIITFFGGVLGYTYAKFQKPVYISKYSFILNENEGGATLNLASLAGIAGISGLGGSTNNVNEDKLLYIANSRQLIGKSLLDKYFINGKSTQLINHFIDIYELSKSFSSDTSLASFSYFNNQSITNLNYKENKVLDMVIKIINDKKLLTIDTKKKTGIVIQSAGIIAMDFKSINEEFSKNFIESLYKNLSEYYVNKTIQRQFKNYILIQNRVDSIRNLLYEKENYAANISDRNLKVVKMVGKVDLERNKRDIQMLSLMYAEVLKNLEVSKFNLDNQTPFFQPVDQPTLPLEMKKKSKLTFSLIGSFLFCSIFSILLLIKNFQKIKRTII